MLHFIGQPKFSGTEPHKLIGYELFAREYQNGQWHLPADFNQITAVSIERMLLEVVSLMDPTIQLLSFNLEQRQFIDPEYAAAILRVQQQTSIQLWTELTERADETVTCQQLQEGAARFKQAGLSVCLDDVGTGANTKELALALGSAVTEYKFALQNFRPYQSLAEVTARLAGWYRLANQQGKDLAIEGIETAEELVALTERFPAKVFQGYYLGKPALLAKGA